MVKMFFLVASVFFTSFNAPRTSAEFNQVSAQLRRIRRNSLEEKCQKPIKTAQNCTMKNYFHYDAQNGTCQMFEDCEENGNKRISTFRDCLDICVRGRRNLRRCHSQLKGKAPERCRWVRVMANNAGGCPKYQLQCTGGPCTSNPCQGQCEICTYNLEFTSKNCSLATLVDGNGEKCPPPFRCEKDIRCTDDFIETSSISPVSILTSTKLFLTTIQSRPPTVQTTQFSKSESTKGEMTVTSKSVQLNFFSTEDESPCLLPAKHETCSTSDSQLIWYFDIESKLCRRFLDTQCSSNANGFQSKEDCMSICQIQQDKPGKCPIATGRSRYNICFRECDHDGDCKNDTKCCANGCAALCLSPAPSISQLKKSINADRNRSKSASCPKGKPQHLGAQNCSEKCDSDEDCVGAKKCCPTSKCGRVCVESNGLEQTPTRTTKLVEVHNFETSDKRVKINPCEGNPCPPRQRCRPILPSSQQNVSLKSTYVCQSIETFALLDPCAKGKHSCGIEENCMYEPQLCLTGPCPQYRCVPASTLRFHIKNINGSHVKRKAKNEMFEPVDPCASNPCRPCQRCIANSLGHEKTMDKDFRSGGYLCENNCLGHCEECTLSGRCAVVNQPYICRTSRAGNPCQNRTCNAYPEAKCVVDQCHCLRVQFELESGVKISASGCHVV